MLRLSLSNTLLAVGVVATLCGCESDSQASDNALCQAPELSAAFVAGSAISAAAAAACEGEDCALAMERPQVASEEERDCAIAGLKQGLSKGYQRGKGREQKQCQRDGRAVGQTAAALYCDLSIALGGLGEDELLVPGPQSACSRAFEAACERAFDRAAKRFADSVGDPSADCTVFTRGEFRRAYEIARFNQCLFSVGEEPPPVDDCSDGSCECRDQASCELDCQGDGCQVLCERTGECQASCGDDCDLTCRDLSRCDARAGDDSSVLCERAGECAIESDGGDATCRDVAHCDAVKHGPGTLRCERAGKCDLTCEGPDCDVVCSHVGECRARIDEGSVRCDHTGKCKVECANGRRARRARDGSFVCSARNGNGRDDCPPRNRR